MEMSEERIELMALRLYSVIDVDEPDYHRAIAKFVLSLLLPAKEALEWAFTDVHRAAEQARIEGSAPNDTRIVSLGKVCDALAALKGAGIG